MMYSHKLPPLQKGTFIQRYKRFLVDISTDQGTITAHCPNSGSMRSLLVNNMPVWFSTHDNPSRKLKHTLEIAQPQEALVGVNTHRANALIHEALQAGFLQNYYNFINIKKEQSTLKSRFDFMLTTDHGPIFLEVKSVTLASNGCALFPDAVTTRGTKHLEDLIALKQAGTGAALLFLIQRSDCEKFAPAESIDPHYTKALMRAQSLIDIHIVGCQVHSDRINITSHIVAPQAEPFPCFLNT